MCVCAGGGGRGACLLWSGLQRSKGVTRDLCNWRHPKNTKMSPFYIILQNVQVTTASKAALFLGTLLSCVILSLQNPSAFFQ